MAMVGLAGSPPPARGAWQAEETARDNLRITPACAGSMVDLNTGANAGEDHPRLRGEHTCVALLPVSTTGSPPPARGAYSCY